RQRGADDDEAGERAGRAEAFDGRRVRTIGEAVGDGDARRVAGDYLLGGLAVDADPEAVAGALQEQVEPGAAKGDGQAVAVVTDPAAIRGVDAGEGAVEPATGAGQQLVGRGGREVLLDDREAAGRIADLVRCVGARGLAEVPDAHRTEPGPLLPG